MKRRTWKKKFIVISLFFFYILLIKSSKKSQVYLKKSSRIELNELVSGHPIGLKYRILPNKSEICSNKKIVYISYVYIDVFNFERRLQIRNSWSNKTLFPFQRNIFVLGSSDKESFNSMIEYENDRHGDILMGNIAENFRLMHSKSILAIGWLTKNCPQIKFYVKLKYDVDLNPPMLANHLVNVEFENYLLCECRSKPKVDRNIRSKFYVRYKEYKLYHYTPRYACTENGYVLSSNLAKEIFFESFKTNIFWIDDIYIANIVEKLNSKLNLIVQNLRVYTIYYENFYLLNNKTMLFYKQRIPLTQDFYFAWDLIKNLTNYSKF